MNIFLFLSLIFLFTFLVGRGIEKISVPWFVAPILLGTLLSIYNPFPEISSSQELAFLADIGKYLLLFVIGLQIDLRRIKIKSASVLTNTFFIIFFEALFGAPLIHYLFDYSWLTSVLVTLSFAAVGQTILIPLLDEYRLINTRFGQTVMGISTLNNVIEIILIIVAIGLLGPEKTAFIDTMIILLSLIFLFLLTIGFQKLKDKRVTFTFLSIHTIYLFILFIFFSFLGIGVVSETGPLAAILAGISVKSFIPKERYSFIEADVKSMVYGFFAPIFFVWVGSQIKIDAVIQAPLLVILFFVISKIAKILASFLASYRELGAKESILLGIALSMRFTTSIIILNLLYERDLIKADLYSIILTSTILFKFFTPILFSRLAVKWKVGNFLARWRQG